MKDILATLPNIDTPYGKMLTISPTSPKDISLLEAYNVKLASPMKGQRTILKESFTLPSIRPNFQITGVKESITHSARKNCPGSSFDGTLNKSKSLNSLGQDTARRSMKWNRGFKQPWKRLVALHTEASQGKVWPRHDAIAGDYIDEPLRVTRMLKGSTYRELTLPLRAQDFHSHVEFRTTLRSDDSSVDTYTTPY